ncbi:MAG: fibronectin type III domain-containing protein [Patescibacteria group bacterium]
MNKQSMLVIGGVVSLLVIGGLVFFSVSPPTSPSPQPQPQPQPEPGSPQSAPQPQAAKAGAPLVTTDRYASPSDSTAVVIGAVNPNGALTDYWYEYGSTPSLGNKTPNQTIGSGYSVIPSPGYIIGLTKGTTYFFRLVGENRLGKSSGAQYSFKTTQGNPAPVGSAPSAKTSAATNVTKVSASLNGQVTPNKSQTQYWFEYGKTNDLGSVTSLVSIGDGSALLSALETLSALTPDTRYYFRLNAQNQFGITNGAILNFRTKK